MGMKVVAGIAVTLLLSACTPVVDPARWDPTMFCKTIKEFKLGECELVRPSMKEPNAAPSIKEAESTM